MTENKSERHMRLPTCGSCHVCGEILLMASDGEEWCSECRAYRRYESHGWRLPRVNDQCPCVTDRAAMRRARTERLQPIPAATLAKGRLAAALEASRAATNSALIASRELNDAARALSLTRGEAAHDADPAADRKLADRVIELYHATSTAAQAARMLDACADAVAGKHLGEAK